jgi:phage terminase large subunit
MEIKLKATVVFEANWKALHGPKRIIRNEGGSRSSKTYSICQCLALYALQNPDKVISVVRKTLPALKTSVFRDFIEVVKDLDIYDPESLRLGEMVYKFPNGTIVEFFSVDNEQKVRGRKRDLLWCNEANEITYEDFNQLILRTSGKIILDYNPSSPDGWFYELPEEKTELIHSTYKSNPFLTPDQIEWIESYRESNEDYYRIFALGERCFSSENVYPQWEICERPEHLTEFIYAVDWGWNHPTALIKIWYSFTKREVWVEEEIYSSNLTAVDVVKIMKEREIDQTRTIVAEVARPEVNHELKSAGYSLINAEKNVVDGILCVKSFRVMLSPDAVNIQKENFNYRWKKVDGKPIEVPVKLWDDGLDALRYGVMFIRKHLLREPGTRRREVWTFEI